MLLVFSLPSLLFLQEIYRQDIKAQRNQMNSSSSCSTPSSPIHQLQSSSSSSNLILQPKNLLKSSKPENNYLLNKSSSQSELVNPNPLPQTSSSSSSGAVGGGHFYQKRCFNNNNNNSNNRLYNNISKSDPKLLDNFFTPPQPSVQQRVASLTGLDGRRSVASPLHSPAPKLQGCQSVPDCVYLRPEQNIPDIFANTKFQPIGGGGGGGHRGDKHQQQSQDGELRGAGGAKMQKNSPTRISRDDIVVTVRSAQV